MQITALSNDISLMRPLEGGNEQQLAVVREVLQAVRERGDEAVRDYTAKWDGVVHDKFRVTKAEIDEAVVGFDAQLLQDLTEAAHNIRLYHEQQKRDGFKLPLADGSYLAQRIIALDAVGLYVPGGSAAYPSSCLLYTSPSPRDRG